MNRIKADKALNKINILYIEDESMIRESFSAILKRHVKQLYIAKNGLEGIEIFKSNHIDIIISDINMPKMNGLEMAKTIKDINREIPIIFTTAFDDSEYLKESIEIGIDGYIIKPIDRNNVFSKLNSMSKSIETKRELEEYIKLTQILLNEQQEGVILFDKKLNIKTFNNAFKNMCKQVNINDIKDINDILTYCIDSKTNKKISKEWFSEWSGYKHSIVVCQKESGSPKRYFKVSAKKVDDYIILTSLDITSLKLENEKFKLESVTDKLTGIYNRKILELKKDSIVEQNICMILFDIDDFKKINDTFGHLAGDKVLTSIVKIVKENLREDDIIIRWGGEEFVILLQKFPSVDIAKKLAETLRKKIDTAVVDEIKNFSCSFGVSCKYIKNLSDIESLFESCDKALYRAKKEGKNRVEIN